MRGNLIPSITNIKSILNASFLHQHRLHIAFGTLLFVSGLLVVGLYLNPELTIFALAAIGIGTPILLLVWFRPEFGILAIIFLTSSFVRADIVDIRLPIGGGFDLRDLAFLGLLGLVFLRELIQKKIVIRCWRVSGPLILFLFLTFFSAFYALFYQNVEQNWVLSDLRILSYYALFFMVIWSIKRIDQLQIMLIGLFVIADLTTLVIYLQQFLGADNPILKVMMPATGWGIYQMSAGVRVVPAGHILMHFTWFIAFGLYVFALLKPPQKYFLLFQLFFIGVGHILTYVRSQWVAMFIGIIFLILVTILKYRMLMSRYMMIGISLFLFMALILGFFGISDLYQIPLMSGIVDRFSSLLSLDSTMESNSLQWRIFENRKAFDSILKHPILGVGLGGRYRELTTLQGEAVGQWTRGSLAAGEVSRFTRYVHNSYLSITVKMGITALIVLVWFFIAFLLNSMAVYRNLNDPKFKGITLGVVAGFMGILAWAYYHAHFIKVEATPVMGLMTGLVAVMDFLDRS